MTRKSPRELAHDIKNLGGDRRRPRPPGGLPERYDRYRADARQRWDADDYPDSGGPLLRVWDAYALAYDDVRLWARVCQEVRRIMIASDPRPAHIPAAPDGYDGGLPVPNGDVRDVIVGLEAAYDVRVKRFRDPDELPEVSEPVDPDPLSNDVTPGVYAELTALFT